MSVAAFLVSCMFGGATVGLVDWAFGYFGFGRH